MDYDDLAAGYARHRRASDAVVAHLVEGGGLCAASVVLEIGCGTANHLAAVCGALAGRGIGVDQSAAMLATARGKMQPGRVVRGRAEALPIADGCVDLAYSVDVVHHLNDVGVYFAEAARVLRPAGRLATVTDSEQTIRARHPLATYFPGIVAPELARYPPVTSLRAAARQAGLVVADTQHVERRHLVTEASSFRDRAYSSLHLIPAAEFEAGMADLERDLAAGPIAATGRNVVLWAARA